MAITKVYPVLMVSSHLVPISHHQIHQLAQGKKKLGLRKPWPGLFHSFQTDSLFLHWSVFVVIYIKKKKKTAKAPYPGSNCTLWNGPSFSGHLES